MDVPNSPTLDALWEHELVGVFEVEFIGGENHTLDVRKTIYSSSGEPLFLQTDTGRVYMWSKIISIELKED